MGNEAGTLRLARDLALLQALQEVATESDDEDIIWDEDDRSKLMVVSDDGHTVKRLSPLPLTTDGVRAKTGYKSGIHIWEITWPRSQRGDYASIGIATQSSTLQYIGQTELIGGNDESVGWNLSKKLAMYNDCVISKYPENKPASYQIPDKITVILDMNVGILKFKVGEGDLGLCASGLKTKQALWYPAVSSDTNAAITIQKVQIPSLVGRKSQVVTRPAADAKCAPLQFYQIYGRHIQMGGDRRSAKRENPSAVHDKAILLTCRPLRNDELFEVEITGRVERWYGTVEIGATTVAPNELNFPETMTDCQQGHTWMYSGTTIKDNGRDVAKMDINCNSLQVGARVGVMRKSNGNLSFFVNGKEVGTGALQTPSDLYGVVDVYGKTSGIRITSPGIQQSQPAPRQGSQQQQQQVPPHSTTPQIGTHQFHRRCGKNVILSADKLSAERKDPLSSNKDGVAITEKPLLDGEVFSVKLVRMVGKWNPSVKIGVIQMLAGCTEIPALSTSSDECCVWSGNDVLHKREFVGSLSKNLNGAEAGTAVGVKYDTDGTLTFYMDGQCVGRIHKKLSGKLHGVVDIYGKTAQVAIVGRSVERARGGTEELAQTAGGSCGTSPSRTEIEGILALMQRAVQILSKPQQHTLAELAKVMESLEGRRSELSTDKEKQIFGDKFAAIGGGKALATCLLSTRSKPIIDEDVLKVDLFILNFCWNASHNSLKFCEAIGEAGLLERLAEDLSKMKGTYSSQDILCMKVMASIAILHNSAKAAGTKEIYKKQSMRQALRAYCDAGNHNIIVMASIQALSYICNPPEEISTQNVKYMVKMLEGCSKTERHYYTENFRGASPNFYAIEILESVTCLARNVKNRKQFVESGITPHIVWVLRNGDDREREQAANAIWTLVDASTRWKISETKDIVESLTILKDTENESLNQAATRACLKLLTQGFGQGDTKASSQSNCDYRKLASRLFEWLELDDAFFNKSFDACYCTVCHAERGDNLYYSRGEPEKDYGLPIGWFRFGLQVPARASAKDVDALNKWHRCFHGTKKESLQKILSIGELLQPGDVALGGMKLGEREGHFTDDRKPSGFDTKQIFLSPSIRYSGHSAYATPFKFVDKKTGAVYVAKVAFQVFVRPGSYEPGDQTVGATEQIDPRFSNQELEWSTKERGATILYGLLVKLDESPIK